jgi:hypothetical protein
MAGLSLLVFGDFEHFGLQANRKEDWEEELGRQITVS